MSVGSIGYVGYTEYTANYIAKQATATSKSSFSGAVERSEAAVKTGKVTESAVTAYKRKHPEDAAHVDGQVKAGKKVLEKNGATDVSREDMTMEEYKQFFTALMDSIPRDPSQKNDVEIWSISEKGWEQMKNDPEYEKWVLDRLRNMRRGCWAIHRKTDRSTSPLRPGRAIRRVFVRKNLVTPSSSISGRACR